MIHNEYLTDALGKSRERVNLFPRGQASFINWQPDHKPFPDLDGLNVLLQYGCIPTRHRIENGYSIGWYSSASIRKARNLLYVFSALATRVSSSKGMSWDKLRGLVQILVIEIKKVKGAIYLGTIVAVKTIVYGLDWWFWEVELCIPIGLCYWISTWSLTVTSEVTRHEASILWFHAWSPLQIHVEEQWHITRDFDWSCVPRARNLSRWHMLL